MTKIQKNAVLDAIQSAGLNPADFEWTKGSSEITAVGPGRAAFSIDVLVHGPTGYSFRFDVDDSRSSLWAVFHPGRDGARRREHAGTWSYVFNYVLEWVSRVKQEHDAPDLWAVIQEQGELITGAAEVENTPFTPKEQEQIEARLNEAKAFVHTTFELEPEQYETIDARLDYLVDAAKRQGRVDWRNIFVGTLLSLVVQAVVPVEPVQQILFIVLRGLAGMFGAGEQPPELPGGPPETA